MLRFRSAGQSALRYNILFFLLMNRSLTIFGLLLPSVVAAMLLTGCGGAEKEPNPEQALRKNSAPEELSARLELRILKRSEEKNTIGIILLNPSGTPIQSVRSWVQFDPATTQVSDLQMVDARFTLFAPGERTIEDGFVKIGVAAVDSIHDESVLLASFTAAKTSATGVPAILRFYDWKSEGDGHSALLSFEGEVIRNVLAPPSSLQL